MSDDLRTRHPTNGMRLPAHLRQAWETDAWLLAQDRKSLPSGRVADDAILQPYEYAQLRRRKRSRPPAAPAD